MGRNFGAKRKNFIQESQGKVVGFKVQGFDRKLERLSSAQLRTMFPQLGHLDDVQLKLEAIKLLREK